jgi:lipoyl(octanoyl) transferase
MGTRFTLLRPGTVRYQQAWELQRRTAEAVRTGALPTLILLDHPPVYTLGARGREANLLLPVEAYAARGAEVQRSDRGGDVTFHGPGQLVGYPILDLRDYGQGPVWYVRSIEGMLIDVLSRFGIVADRSAGRPGVWVGEKKIAAIGVRVSRGVTTHGFALNVTTDLAWFRDIIPCGLPSAGVTSMQELTGETFAMRQVEAEVIDAFARQFDAELTEDETAGAAVGC